MWVSQTISAVWINTHLDTQVGIVQASHLRLQDSDICPNQRAVSEGGGGGHTTSVTHTKAKPSS